MEKVILKPYKRKMSSWQYDEEQSRLEEDSNRYILSVQIGERLTIDEETSEKLDTAQLAEDIYLDTLQGIFLNQKGYEVTVTLGCEPQVVITYEGRLVMHNDKIPQYEKEIMELLKKTKSNILVQTLVDFTAHENSGGKYTDLARHVQESINKVKGTNYPLEFIAYAIKDYICDIKRQMTEEKMEYAYMTYEELLQVAGDVLAAKLKGEKDEREEYVQEELLYRFIQGSIISKG